ncbi:MAG: DUF1993 domain-containing protein [Burkholderiaceae bacterium]|nr:DUF1993 domain-containing protein [Burkholderiaceae bacterium]
MSITMSSASLPVLRTALSNLYHCLVKASDNARRRGFDPDVFVGLRLAPDMLPLAAQVRIACDVAKYGAARLGGLQAPRDADDETTLDQLKARIARTLDWLGTVPAEAIDGSEAREIRFTVGRAAEPRVMAGEAYLKHWVLPNLFFHVTTTYALLRQAGVDLGKADFLQGDAAP